MLATPVAHLEYYYKFNTKLRQVQGRLFSPYSGLLWHSESLSATYHEQLPDRTSYLYR